MADLPENPKQSQQPGNEIALSIGVTALSLVLAYFSPNAIFTTCVVAVGTFFLSNVLFTSLTEQWLSRAARVRFQFVITTTVVLLSWHFYFENQYHEQRASAVEGVLIPEKAILSNQATIRAALDGPVFTFSNSLGSSSLPPGVYRPDLQVREGPSGVILTTSVKDREGHQVVAIKKNHWVVYPPYCSDKNYTSNSLEVKDSTGDVVLQVVLNGSRAYVKGIWRDQFGAGAELVSDENEQQATVISWANGAEERQNEQLISPSFIYPSSEHWGEKIPRMTVDDFDLSQNIDVSNRSSEPLVALEVTVATVPPTLSYTRDLNNEIDPNKTKSIELPNYTFTVPPTGRGSFEDHWKKAKSAYGRCAGLIFLGGTNQKFAYIIQAYRAAKLPVPYGRAVGILTYKSKRSQMLFTTHFTAVAFATRINGCPP